MCSFKLDTKIIKEFQSKLKKWHKENDRKFIWRAKVNPYDIFIAELLLQKTNAEKVEKVYPKFLENFPNFKSLVNASDEKITNCLRYLGLQNEKLRIIKNISQTIVNKYNSKIPSDKEKLLKLYGIGNYIANAILCFAFNQRVPIIDGNIIRILERAFGIKSNKKNPISDKEIWQIMEKILPLKDYRKFNFALLDFAALLCKFYNPKCQLCFFNRICCYNNRSI